MSWEAWFTIGITIALFVAMLKEAAPADVLFALATTLLAAAKIISPTEALAGFSNPAMLTVAAMFVVAAAMRDTGILDFIGQRVLGRVTTEGSAFRRLAALIVPLSAFMNNTPIVAMMMPMVIEWCRRRNVSPSRLLIPVSYLTILGGTCTLIGTSTNLVVDGLMRTEYDKGLSAAEANHTQPAVFTQQLKGMSLLEIAPVGICYAIIGTLYIGFFGPRLLPARKELMEQFGDSRREYLVEMQIEPHCRLIGQTVEMAGLRHLPGLFLIEIDRGGQLITPVSPEEPLLAGDRLVFAGVVASIVDLERIDGFRPAGDPDYQVSRHDSHKRQLCEAVISNTSPLIGKTVREAEFRATYNAAVLAVHRDAARLTNKVGDIEIRPGDTLLLQTSPHFLRAHRNNSDFYLVSGVEDWRPLRRDRAWISLALFAVLLAMMSFEWLPAAIAAVLIACLMILTGCVSQGDARRSIEWQVLLTIAMSFGVGAALQNSGAAATIAEGLVHLTRPLGPLAALACIYLLGSFLTELVSNNAVAVLLFPFCLETARLFNTSPRPFLVALMLAASASFATPIGYQTNMMVYGPGGYRFGDFLRIGVPLNFLMWIAAMILIPIYWPLT